MRFTLRPKLLLLINVFGIALATLVIVLLYQLDGVVHGLLYNYGLQFDYEWAIPYWTFLRLSLGLLAGIAGAGAFSMLYIVLSSEISPLRKTVSTELRPKITREPERAERDLKLTEPREIKDDGVEVTALPLVCNKCGKVFTQPLCMFDFKSGKPRLVNVCPYCSAVLAVAGNGKS